MKIANLSKINGYYPDYPDEGGC